MHKCSEFTALCIKTLLKCIIDIHFLTICTTDYYYLYHGSIETPMTMLTSSFNCMLCVGVYCMPLYPTTLIQTNCKLRPVKILCEYFTSLTTARRQLSCKFRVVEWLHSAGCLMKYISSNCRLLWTARCAHSKQLDWVSSIVTSLIEQKQEMKHTSH